MALAQAERRIQHRYQPYLPYSRAVFGSITLFSRALSPLDLRRWPPTRTISSPARSDWSM